jgi:excisionase family DNA binding protein
MRIAKIPQPIRGNPASPWITVKQAADYLGVGVEAIYDACANKGLKHSKLGRSTIRLRREWVDEWAESLAR